MIRTLLGPVKTALLLVCLFATLAAVMSVIVTPAARAESCPNEALRSGASANLPDCRAYEQVSPVQKNGAYIEEGSTISSPEGEAVGFTSTSGFAGATSDLYSSTGYQSTRGPASWVTTAQTQSEARYVQHHSLLATDYLDETFGNALESGPRKLEGGARLYLLQEFGRPEAADDFYRTAAGGVNEEVGPAYPPTASNLRSATGVEESEDIDVLGWSADASHVVFTNPEPPGPNQWPFAEAGSLLEYAGAGNTTPLLVGVNNEGTFVNDCPTQYLGGVEPGSEGFNHVQNPISANGGTLFFTDGCKGELFARVDNGQPDAHTVAISQPTTGAGGECVACVTDPAEPKSARFFGASEDGSKVFFYTEEPLLGGTEGLYEYDFDAPEGEKVTLIAGGFFGRTSVLQTSQDGSHIYFFSSQVLTPQPSPTVQGRNAAGEPVTSGAVAQEGENNVYVYERDARYPAGHISFVAILGSERYSKQLETDTTPDGRFLILNVHPPLTADDLGSASQIFEYDASTETMKRISIGEDGFNDNGLALLSYPSSTHRESEGEDETFRASNDAYLASNGSVEATFHPSAYSDHLAVSADGSYVFFTSPIALTPHALNRAFLDIETEGYAEFAENVYEYHDGNVYLISDGSDISVHNRFSQVHLLSTDLSGRDVFFETVDPLVPQDTDTNKDIYDARIDGGFPAPAAPAECSGDACQGELSGAPVLLSPGSEHQAGGDNLTPAAAPPPGVKSKALTARQKLAAALKGCRRAKTKKKHGACERTARAKYAPAKKAEKTDHRGKGEK